MTPFYDLPKPRNDALARSESLSEVIRQEMAQQGGLISFANFMELALYHPQFGYYHSENFDLGKHGDFTTAPEVTPLFAKCFTRQALQVFELLGTKHILELGAGTGRFAKDFLLEMDKLGSLPDQYYIYEISPTLRKKQQDLLQAECPALFKHITWLEALPQNFKGMIVANEVLDALPTHCFRIENETVKERCVAYSQDQFVWRISAPTTNELAEQAQKICEFYGLTEGYESEINLRQQSFIQAISNSMAQGIILFADYGYGQREYYRPERRTGTLTCFYQHRKHDNPLILPGLQDITAHVDFTSVIENAALNGCTLIGYTTQAAFLLGAGLLDFALEEEKTLAPVDEFELHQAIKILTLPSEMGERIKIMALGKNIDLPLLGFGLQDRRRDL